MTACLVKVRESMQLIESIAIINYIDTDECTVDNPTHDCDHFCNNTVGGYDCSCEETFILMADGRSCEGM